VFPSIGHPTEKSVIIIATPLENLMFEMQRDRHNPAKRYCVGIVPRLEDIPLALEPISTNYCLFLAMDATSIANEALRKTAKSLLDRGLAYFCVWGPDCERMHDQLDLERMPEEPKERTVMTTWHSKDSLSKALWFFANCVEPVEGFAADCTDWVAVSVVNETWLQQIRTDLIQGRVTGKDAPPAE
jgi:hypothetical protein